MVGPVSAPGKWHAGINKNVYFILFRSKFIDGWLQIPMIFKSLIRLVWCGYIYSLCYAGRYIKHKINGVFSFSNFSINIFIFLNLLYKCMYRWLVADSNGI